MGIRIKLIQAILSGKPFRRPSWVDTEDKYKWVVYSPEYCDFCWANEDGSSSGNCFGDLYQIIKDNDEKCDDYEILV